MGKKKKVTKKPNQVWKLYDAKGKLERKNAVCPKCGPGFFMSAHKDRKHCGNCGYSEIGK